MKFRSDDEYREQIFNEWFKKTTKVYELMREGKCCDIGIDIIYPPFISTFSKAYRCYMKHYDTIADCYSDCISLVWEGMLKFKIKDESTWEAIAKKEDMSNYKRLVTFLKKYVINKIRYLNEDFVETSKWVKKGDNKKMLHIYTYLTTESLNQITTFDNSLEQVEVQDTVTSSYWEQKLNYKYDLFMQWARDNMYNEGENQILTKSQRDFLMKLQAANYSSLDKDYDREALEGCYAKLKLERIRDKVSAKYIEAIQKKVSEGYNEQKKYFMGGFIIQTFDEELKSYEKFIRVIEDEKADGSDDTLTRLVLNSMNNPYWERLIYDDLSYEAQQDIIWVYLDDTIIYEDYFKFYRNSDSICHETFYELVNAIYKRIELVKELRAFELHRLEREADAKKLKLPKTKYTLPENYSILFLNINADGIALPK